MIHYILFTGHMIDAKDRSEPRFPPEKEVAVKEAIKKILITERENNSGGVKGIAGGASGGDILFHELCSELQIPSEMFLAIGKEPYKEASVSFAGETWAVRFDHLTKTLPVSTLPGSADDDQNIWVRTNLWMLEESLKNGGVHMTLIALWNGKGGDGEGGTEHLVSEGKAKGAKTIIVDINKL